MNIYSAPSYRKNDLSKRAVIAYFTLPQLLPRIRELFVSGFHQIPYFIALVYQIVRLLPPAHPYLNRRNIGQFGIRHVIAAAAGNLVFKRQNIDQILLFFTVLVALGITFMMLLLVGFSLFMQASIAQDMPTSFKGFFIAPNPEQDMAGMMMDMVFGIPDVFNSCVSTGGGCETQSGVVIEDEDGNWILDDLGFPFPIHIALHALFRIYSIALLVIAALILAYFVFTVVLETAQTGTAFGKRYNKVWAPLRIVVAFGLLIPIGQLNSAQYIVLYAAKFGSGFASNGWVLFNESITGNALIAERELISSPNPPEINTLMQFMFVASVCKQLHEIRPLSAKEVGDPKSGDDGYRDVNMYLVRNPLANPDHLLLKSDVQVITDASGKSTTIVGEQMYKDMIKFANGDHQVSIRFGRYSLTDYPLEKGHVSPICGELILPLSDPRSSETTAGGKSNPPEEGTRYLQNSYMNAVSLLWNGAIDESLEGVNYPENIASRTTWKPDIGEMPDENTFTNMYKAYRDELVRVIDVGRERQIESPTFKVDQALKDKGWAAAGIWYNKIAQLNGDFTSAVRAIPYPRLWPSPMEQVARQKLQSDGNPSATTLFQPDIAEGAPEYDHAYEDQMAYALWLGYKVWVDAGFATSPYTAPTGNIFIDFINAILGTEGLFNMRKNQNIHPLAQLVGIGKSLIDGAVYQMTGTALGVMAGALDPKIKSLSSMVVSVLTTITGVTIAAGFLLYYVVPFFPFIYFFFAVGGWVKSIFEAMIGAPLWALAHIRIDDEGLPGPAAKSGYFLIFEIFLRPILIVFGLLGSIVIFGALVSALNEVWDLVVNNLGGFDAREAAEKGFDCSATDADCIISYMRSPIDEFFYTLLYAVVAYVMALSSFKMIDLVPNQILRWMGQSVAGFNDQNEDPVSGLASKATLATDQFSSNVLSKIPK